MSRTYDIACKTCRETLWIGQGWPLTPERVLAGEEDRRHIYGITETLRDFLFRHEATHEKHELVFIDNEYLDEDETWHSVDDECCDCVRCRKDQVCIDCHTGDDPNNPLTRFRVAYPNSREEVAPYWAHDDCFMKRRPRNENTA